MGDFGYIAASMGPGPHLKMVDKLPGGIKPEDYDYSVERVVGEELKRCGSWALVDGLGGGCVIGLPPVLNFGSPELVQRVAPAILRGEKRICLAITDPYAGSDVANSTAEAKLSADGSHYVVNGLKKWITGGYDADYFTALVRTGGKGHGGLSLLLIERTEGVTTKRIKTSYSSVAGTSLITFENVKVPASNLLGKEGGGFLLAMANFNHERWGMAVGGNRQNRLIIEECYKWAYNRKVFGKRLIHQPQIQERLATMCAYVDSVSALIDNVTYKMCNMSYAEQTTKLSGAISLLKNQQVEASRVVNDGAIQIFGGRALTQTGLGSKLENFQRTYQYGAVLGGASSVLATQAVRASLKGFPEESRL
ncbi:Short-chain specific acyl-CoA dehydrogenase, mitochondrial [Hondaea fermentalgiana]|uniref:Short-chain specific acyl-CoA dehydrogenase, mitochondrial n=1 Tax=Hondaea fermentalgiana TaxID=2315210 RepID=A0A2R5G1L6_9STRA|nr:Short-chain specific acyl-CoA dehydrogenase, mitochondrial [Hondaea fermentalgiana]|eukprot:GBG24900.1 Short-chain specific acyl-CoA dehydrogenase, mitochondrial [Hondaea fermentalgiana]